MMDPDSRERQVIIANVIFINSVMVNININIILIIIIIIIRRVNTTGFHLRQPEEIHPLQIVDMQVLNLVIFCHIEVSNFVSFCHMQV